MQKVKFICSECETEGNIKLGDDFDDNRIEYCPCCGSPLGLDDDFDSEED